MHSYNSSGRALVTPRGIMFLNSYYSCSRAISGQWFEIAQQHGDWNIEVMYNPEEYTRILIKSVVATSEVEVAELVIPEEISGSKLEKYFRSIQKLKALKN
jgi:hypothetical protein